MGWLFKVLQVLTKGINNTGRLYLPMGKNFTELLRKLNDTTSMLWSVQYFNGKMLVRFFFGDALSKPEYSGDKNLLCCYWPDFSFSFSDEEMDTSSDSDSSPTNQPVVPFALGQVKILFTKPSHAKHLLTSNIQNNDLKNVFHWHKKYMLAKFHSFKNTSEFKFYALRPTDWLTDSLKLTDSIIEWFTKYLTTRSRSSSDQHQL